MPIYSILPLFFAVLIVIVSYSLQTKLILHYYRKYKTISNLYIRPFARGKFRVGLILTGLFQILFVLSIGISNDTLFYSLGVFLFVLGGLGSILLGMVSLKENERIHYFAANLYFWGLAFSGIILSFNLNIPLFYSVILISIIISWIIIAIKQIPLRNHVYASETYHVILSYVWIFLVALANIIYIAV